MHTVPHGEEPLHIEDSILMPFYVLSDVTASLCAPALGEAASGKARRPEAVGLHRLHWQRPPRWGTESR